VKAVNLLPPEARRGGDSGERPIASYALLAGLAVILVLVLAYVQAANSVTSRRAELADVERQLAIVQRQDAPLAASAKFAVDRDARANAIRTVLASRFPWSRTLRSLSIALPGDVRLQSLNAKAAAASGPDPAAGPTLDLTGCGASHRAVARTMVGLRQVTGVTDVSLTNSTHAAAAGAGSGTATSGGGSARGCSTTFSMTVTLNPPSAPASGSGTAATPAAGTATTPAPGATTTTPAPGATTPTTATPASTATTATAPGTTPAAGGSTTAGATP
jgi:Tfp pilus assembly protein PilN